MACLGRSTKARGAWPGSRSCVPWRESAEAPTWALPYSRAFRALGFLREASEFGGGVARGGTSDRGFVGRREGSPVSGVDRRGHSPRKGLARRRTSRRLSRAEMRVWVVGRGTVTGRWSDTGLGDRNTLGSIWILWFFGSSESLRVVPRVADASSLSSATHSSGLRRDCSARSLSATGRYGYRGRPGGWEWRPGQCGRHDRASRG